MSTAEIAAPAGVDLQIVGCVWVSALDRCLLLSAARRYQLISGGFLAERRVADPRSSHVKSIRHGPMGLNLETCPMEQSGKTRWIAECG